jgi:sec-independent protein translocase protein TatA
MLGGWEWLIIGVVAIVIILWGSAKFPEFAKALGRAKGEFSRVSKEFTDAVNAVPIESKPKPTIKIKDEILLDTAKNLGIPTDGKTREQISKEISLKITIL